VDISSLVIVGCSQKYDNYVVLNEALSPDLGSIDRLQTETLLQVNVKKKYGNNERITTYDNSRKFGLSLELERLRWFEV
jgi:hypothetical protein